MNKWEVNLLIEYLEDYVQAKTDYAINSQNDNYEYQSSTETITKKRELLINHLNELVKAED